MAGSDGFFKKLARSPEELVAESLRDWASSIEDVTAIASAPSREHVRVAGVVQSIRIDPREGSGAIQATLSDGTGEMLAKWLGRQTLSGIRLGAALILEGIIGEGPGGQRVILNPEYDLVQGPWH